MGHIAILQGPQRLEKVGSCDYVSPWISCGVSCSNLVIPDCLVGLIGNNHLAVNFVFAAFIMHDINVDHYVFCWEGNH